MEIEEMLDELEAKRKPAPPPESRPAERPKKSPSDLDIDAVWR